MLDLSYNDLNSIDFHLFLRNFQHLESLNLEGNNLTEIDTITRVHFPNLSALGISKNRFTCDYLAKFLLQWHDLKLVHNPSSNQMHIGGADCINGNQTTENMTTNKNNTNGTSNTIVSEHHLNELNTIKILLIILVAIILIVCSYLLLTYDKCKPVKNSYKNWTSAKIANESFSYTNQAHNALYNEIDNNVYNELSIKVN